MNSETYEEVTISEEMIGLGRYFVQEGMQVQLSMYEENPIGIQLPQTVTLEIMDTEPGMKGATATNSPKPITGHPFPSSPCYQIPVISTF